MFALYRLNPEASEKIYEVEDVLEAFDGLQKAARSDVTTSSLSQTLWEEELGFPSLPAESWTTTRGSSRSATRAKWRA